MSALLLSSFLLYIQQRKWVVSMSGGSQCGWMHVTYRNSYFINRKSKKIFVIVWLTGDLWKCSAAFKVLPKNCNLPRKPLHTQPSIVYKKLQCICFPLWDKCKHIPLTIFPLYLSFSQVFCCPSLAMRWPNILAVQSWWWGQRCWQMGERGIKWPLGTGRRGEQNRKWPSVAWRVYTSCAYSLYLDISLLISEEGS